MSLSVSHVNLYTLSSKLNFKGALLGLRQFFATESRLKMMENVFYYILKALFVIKIFKFLSWVFGQ